MTTDEPPAGPLTGVTVLELGSTVAAPFCGRLLADFGATVVKVELAEGDPIRSMGKQLNGRSLYAASIFRNKRLISVDLRQAEGQEIIRKLARRCEILIENFRPGTMERWNLGYEQLRAIRPSLVMVRISGFGQDGPYSQRPGFGVIAEAVGGLRHITGDPDRPPARVAVSLTDYLSGLYAAFGAVMALMVSRQTGQGQIVDAALAEAALSMLEPHIPAYEKLGVIANRAGTKLPDNVPNALYPTGDGSYIHIATVGEPTWRRLAEAMGQPDLVEDPRFRTARDRARNEAALEPIIVAWTTAHPLAELERRLESAGVPATRIFTVADIFRDPHLTARQALVDAPDAELGSVKTVNVVPRLSATPGRVRFAGRSQAGADTRQVLRELADFSDGEIDRLVAAGTIVCAS